MGKGNEMTQIETLKDELKKARIAKDTFRKMILGTLVSEAVMVGKNMGNRETTDNEVLKLVGKFKKNTLETANLVDPSSDVFALLGDEVAIYDEFLPTQLTDEEITREIGIYLQMNAEKANLGSVMAHFRQNFDGQYDGKALAKVTNEILKGV